MTLLALPVLVKVKPCRSLREPFFKKKKAGFSAFEGTHRVKLRSFPKKIPLVPCSLQIVQANTHARKKNQQKQLFFQSRWNPYLFSGNCILLCNRHRIIRAIIFYHYYYSYLSVPTTVIMLVNFCRRCKLALFLLTPMSVIII